MAAPARDSLLERWFCSACAGVLSELVTYPLDLLSTRLMLQSELGRSLTGAPTEQRLKSYTQVFLGVVRNEGAMALYRGAGVASFRQVFNAGTSVALYPVVRAKLLSAGETAGDAPLWKRALAGAITGAMAQVVSNPADVLKVRIQADGRLRLVGKPPRYTGARHAAVSILKEEGVRGFYTALSSSMWRACTINAAGIASYDHTKQVVARMVQDDTSLLPPAAGALVTGAVTAIVASPLNVVRTRLMNAPAAYAGAGDCARQLLAKEGVSAFFKGFIPMYQRQAVFNFTFWIVLEHFQQVLGAQRL